MRLISLFAVLGFPAFAFGQLHALPTIDEPQDTDRIFTYTRGFAAAYRLDSLKSYFQAGGTFSGRVVDTIYLNGTSDSLVVEFTDGGSYLIGDIVFSQELADGIQEAKDYADANDSVSAGDGNGIYDGSGSVPDDITVSSKLYPTGAVDGSQIYFSELLNSQYYTGWRTLNEDGDGFELLTRRNVSGAPIATYLKLADGDDASTFASRTWYYTNLTAGYIRGIDWGRTVPAYRVAASDFLDIPSALPTNDGSVFVSDSDGSGEWKEFSSANRAVRTTNLTRITTSYLSDAQLQHTGLAAGVYKFKAVLIYKGNAATTDMRYRLDRNFALSMCTFSRSDNNQVRGVQGFGYTADVENAIDPHIVVLEGVFDNGVSGNSVEIEWGGNNTSASITMIEGSYFEIEKIN